MTDNERAGRFIVAMSPACWVTLAGGACSMLAVLILSDSMATPGRRHYFFLGCAFMFLGLLGDALDGLLARRWRQESDFGKYLDSISDAITFLVAPAVALRALGVTGIVPSLALLFMVGAGLTRLARFTMIGNVDTGRGKGYLGLPCYYSHFAVVVLYPVRVVVPPWAFLALTTVTLLGLGFLFVYRVTFRKPTNLLLMLSVIGSFLVAAVALFALRVSP